jgi:Zn-dependent M28 family amino/carboxypeptidase
MAIWKAILLLALMTLASWGKEEDDDHAPAPPLLALESIRAHQKELEAIADAHHGTRAVTSEGYKASVDYVEQKLKEAGFNPSRQDFNITVRENNSEPLLEINGDSPHSFVGNVDFSDMSQAGTAETSGNIEGVDLLIPSPFANASTSGCEKSDFINFTKGAIALLQRGRCTFQQKIDNAQEAGASAIIIFNEGNPGRTQVFHGRSLSKIPNFPILAASFRTGEQLNKIANERPRRSVVHIKVDVVERKKVVQNLIAQTAQGDEGRVVVVGAHLDSVAEGPGINDNGSGTSTILAIAEKIAAFRFQPKNKIRFVWFAAEELGLLGSKFYVSSLSSVEQKNILAMLNFDMLSSSNYVRFVYDGDSFSEGSGFIERIFVDYFSSKGLVSNPTSFDGRSDYGPFIGVGIPSGGLFSGAEGIKSARLAQIYGGIAEAPFDPCYHKDCDNFANTGGDPRYALALKSLSELSEAAFHAVKTLADTTAKLREEPSAYVRPDFEYEGDFLIK